MFRQLCFVLRWISFEMEFFITIGLILTALYWLNNYLLTRWTSRGYPQLNPKPVVGDIGGMFMLKKSMGEYFQELYNDNKNHRALGLYFSYRPALLVNDPLLIQDIMVRDFTSFHDRPFHVDEVHDPLTGHLFSLSGQKWRDLRVKLSPTFTSGKLKGMFPIIKNCGQVLQEYLVKNVKEGKDEIEFRDLMARYTTNIISSVAFGIDNDCINDPEHIFRKMGAKIFEPSLKQGITDLIAVFVPKVFKYIPIKSVEPDIEEFIFSIVKQTIDYREKNNFSRNDFMQLMIQLKNQGYVSADKESSDEKVESKGDVKKMTINEIAAQVFIFFVAGESLLSKFLSVLIVENFQLGFETSSSTIFYCLFELAKNPECQQKVQEEIDRVLKVAGADGVTYEMLHDLKYLECCIDETLRKYPIAPTLIRECTKDYNISGTDLTIPKGTSIFIPVLGHHRDPEIYENPMKFKPERFENSPTGGGTSNGIFYLPFGDGPRNCIGMRMGKITTKVGLALVLSKFNFDFCDKTLADKEMEFHPNQFILTPKEIFNFKITAR